jgi:hypothetical protein
LSPDDVEVVSRGGYDIIFDSSTGFTRYVVEPTHDAEPFHHFGAGCTTLSLVDEMDTIELRFEDLSCKLEVDAWELMWYIVTEEFVTFDVWLSTDGIANICESVASGDPDQPGVSAPPYDIYHIPCGQRRNASCWEFDICPDTSYGWIDDSSDDLIDDDTYMDWYGWGVSSGTTTPSYEWEVFFED